MWEVRKREEPKVAARFVPGKHVDEEGVPESGRESRNYFPFSITFHVL